MRLVIILLLLSALLAVPFLLWGEGFDAWLGGESAVETLRAYGAWAWLVAIGFLAADLVLPIPSTAVMAALGLIYGTFLGGLIGSLGSVLAGQLAYWLSRCFGRGVARWIAGAEELERGERLFDAVGGWLVALSRWLPLLPEVTTCSAGLARMRLVPFTLALICGSVPMAFTFAAVGHLGDESPVLAVTLSAVLPLIIWPIVHLALRRTRARSGEDRDRRDSPRYNAGQ